MTHQIMPLPFKPPRLDGLSERLLASHYENNYGGAVRRLNAIERRLGETDWNAAPVFDINGLKREELVAANSAILHEIYFDGLGGSGDAEGDLAAALERDFGSVAAWRGQFMAVAKAQAGGSGWTLLTWSERHARLMIQWAA
ncbi:MAG: Fe-Mn family superoxide dismutase, partial [Phreatobacter sp.]